MFGLAFWMHVQRARFVSTRRRFPQPYSCNLPAVHTSLICNELAPEKEGITTVRQRASREMACLVAMDRNRRHCVFDDATLFANYLLMPPGAGAWRMAYAHT